MRKKLPASALRRLIEERAGYRCEYCHAPQPVCGYRFHLDHIIPRSNGGPNKSANRALACAPCNLAKRNRHVGIDPKTGVETSLFNPRTDRWSRHFRWDGDKKTLRGLTSKGRATVAALDMNSKIRREGRQLWFDTGWLP